MKTATKKTTTPIAPAPKTYRSAAELLARLPEWTKYRIDTCKRSLAESVKRQLETFTKVAADLNNMDAPDWSASYEISQSYWPLGSMHEENGKLTILFGFKKSLEAMTELGLDPMATLKQIAADNGAAAIRDNHRVESSTNAYSNAKTASEGEGRGQVYREIFDMLESYIAEATQHAKIADDVAAVLSREPSEIDG